MAATLSAAEALTFYAFTRASFPTPQSALPLLEAFVEAGEPFIPSRYGAYEPLRTPFDAGALLAPARMLSDRPCDLFLKRSRPSMEASLTWKAGRARPWIWSVRMSSAWMKPSTCAPARLTTFLVELCARFPPVFAICATTADLARQHTVYSPTTGEDLGMRGLVLGPGEGLPGVCWLTFFGPELVAFFGRERLLSLDVHRVFDRGPSGVGVLLQESPHAGTPVTRQRLESAVVAALGQEFFFELAGALKSPPPPRTPIPGATDHS